MIASRHTGHAADERECGGPAAKSCLLWPPSADSGYMSVQLLRLRRFGMVYSFLRAATDALDDPVFKKAGAHEPLGRDRSGKPLPPDEFSCRVAKMNQADVSKLVAPSCVAVTNIGCAYEHAFKLLHHIETGLVGERSVSDACTGELAL